MAKVLAECVYCFAMVESRDTPVPATDDDAAWQALAKEHEDARASGS